MEKFIAYQKRIYKLPDEQMALLIARMEEVKYCRGEKIVIEGQADYYVYFVKEGLARAYVVRDGKDVTLWFAREGEMVLATARRVSTVTVEVLEDTVVYRILQEHLEALFEHSLELANWGRKVLEQYLAEYEHYFTEYSWNSAREQYEDLTRQFPEMMQKVPLKYIASYLQITPQSLSRIRAGKKKKPSGPKLP